MAEKLAPPGELFLRKGRESVVSLEMDRLAPGEESSDSEGEQEGGSHRLIRKVSTSGQMRAKVRTAPPGWLSRVSILLSTLPILGSASDWFGSPARRRGLFRGWDEERAERHPAA